MEWRRLHNGEFPILYRTHNIVGVIKSGRLRLTDRVARMVDGRIAFNILIGKPTGKRSSGRPKRRSEDNIRIYLK